MMFRRTRWLALAWLCSLALCGCQSENPDSEEPPDLGLPELNLGVLDEVEGFPGSTDNEPTRVELKLQIGERFPLKKTVIQRLIQGGTMSESVLDMWMSITVKEIRSDRIDLGVRYLDVAYRHNIAGKIVVYDSRARQDSIPDEARLYEGLVGNGFDFSLNKTNEIVAVEGFDAFLHNCVRRVPIDQRQAALDDLVARVGESRIANFVDDSIGMFPNGEARPGDSWKRVRNVLQPVPMQLEQTCSLARLTEETAEIDVVGRVQPTVNRNLDGSSGNGLQVHVAGGQSYGRCVVRRNCGLPINSEVKLMLDLKVQLPGGQVVDQRKEIITRIETFQQSGPTLEISRPNRASAGPAGNSGSR